MICKACDGKGTEGHDCGDDTCCCLDPVENVLCGSCGGRGKIPPQGYQYCPECNGLGKGFHGADYSAQPCAACAGAGVLDETLLCAICNNILTKAGCPSCNAADRRDYESAMF